MMSRLWVTYAHVMRNLCVTFASWTTRATAAKRKTLHWTREETLNLTAVWGEPHYQKSFNQMVHNHLIIFQDFALLTDLNLFFLRMCLHAV